jgi:hypothetical protein
VLQLLFTANIPSLLIFSSVKLEAICSSETSVLTRAKRPHIPEDGIFLKSLHIQVELEGSGRIARL